VISPGVASFVPINYLVAPTISPVSSKAEEGPRMLTIILRASGEADRDGRRIRRICLMLRSSPGKDRFSFLVFEHGHRYLVEYPNDTIGLNPDVLRKLIEMVGEENIRVETIQFQ
jgi:DNA polymerase-3 subunit alpha